jgi:hypothetical protein
MVSVRSNIVQVLAHVRIEIGAKVPAIIVFDLALRMQLDGHPDPLGGCSWQLVRDCTAPKAFER